MPNFTITTNNSKDFDTSKEQIVFADDKSAIDDAQVALGEMVRDNLPDGKHADFGVQVENDVGKQIYRARLNFDATSEAEIDREEDEADEAAQHVASKLAGQSE